MIALHLFVTRTFVSVKVGALVINRVLFPLACRLARKPFTYQPDVARNKDPSVSPSSSNTTLPAHPRSGILTLIGITKLFEAFLLLVVATGALRLLHGDVAETLHRWIKDLHMDPDGRYLREGISKLLSVNEKTLRELSVVLYIYFALHCTEGVGLLLHKRWAEYFTVISTSLLVPLEVWEVTHKFSGTKVIVLIANLAIVAYLIYRLRAARKKAEPAPA
jgi:uncharacterized membrane protein (DUF2068 family)